MTIFYKRVTLFFLTAYGVKKIVCDNLLGKSVMMSTAYRYYICYSHVLSYFVHTIINYNGQITSPAGRTRHANRYDTTA